MDDLRAIHQIEPASALGCDEAWRDALLAARLLQCGGPQIGGLWLRARAGGVRDAYLDHLRTSVLSDLAWVRVPNSVSHAALLGQIDIPATASTGRVVTQPGLLTRADGGVLLLPMAERLDAATAVIIGHAMDSGTVRRLQHGSGSPQEEKARFQVIALDEAASAEETLPAALGGRLGLRVDLNAVSWSAVRDLPPAPCQQCVPDWRQAKLTDPMLALLSAIATASGHTSLRVLHHLATVSRLSASLEDRCDVGETDALLAIRLCLGVRLQAQPDQPETDMPEPARQPSPDTAPDPPETRDPPSTQDLTALSELLAAVEAGTIDGLPEFDPTRTARSQIARSGKSGVARKDARRGRPVSVSRSAPFPNARPNIIATLRAAAPWQVIRGRNRALLLSRVSDRHEARGRQPRALITKDDYRYQRLRHETPSTAIFMVDASGSTALERLGETKGAIEQLLARCYVRRDEVAMIAFRGCGAETVLAPTRSLVMAKRKLAGLPGGGPTPLVSGLEKGLELGLSVRRQGSTPVMVLLTDGRGNIARNGEPDRGRAQEELGHIADRYRSLEMRSICIDIARRPRDAVATLAEKMGADLHFLRHADAAAMSDVVNASLEEART